MKSLFGEAETTDDVTVRVAVAPRTVAVAVSEEVRSGPPAAG